MEALAGRASFSLQTRFFLIPWVMRSKGICSATEGTDNPPFPVRYIPKTSIKTEKPQTRAKPMKGLDKHALKKGLDLNFVRCEVSNKRMDPENGSTFERKPQSLSQGLMNGLPKGSYQELDQCTKKQFVELTGEDVEIYHDVGTMVDELKEDANDLEIHRWKFPLSHDLQAYEDKDDAENAAMTLLTTRVKANVSSNPNRHVSKNSLKLENGQTRPTPVKGSEVKDMKGADPNIMKSEVANGRMVSRNSISDKKMQYLNQGPASSLTRFRQETNSEMKCDEETMNDEYMEEPKENAEVLGSNLGNYSLSQDLQACENKEEAEKAAIRLLASRAYTAVELRKKLHGKRFPTSTIDAVVRDFQSRGLINDCFYAESFARSRWSSSSWGPRRVKQALRSKGVTEVDTEEALKLVYEDGDQDSSLGLSKVSMDQLYTQASKQWLRGQDISIETRKSRLIRWLQYRGFSWGVTSFILKKLESKHPS